MVRPHSCILTIINNIKPSDQRGLDQTTNLEPHKQRQRTGKCRSLFVWKAKQLEVKFPPFGFLLPEG